MPRQPVRFEFAPLPHAACAEAAARRRMHGIEAGFPAVLEWNARLEAPEDGRYAALLRVRVVGGRTITADALGHDALAALRLAFNALEVELEADQESARTRAAAWLVAVRQRMRGSPSGPQA
jgi:hypothetical protein